MKRIQLSDLANKFLLKSDRSISKRIISKIEILLTSPNQLQIKKLRGKENLYRIRVEDYRIIFEIHKDVILISKIGHRKNIYE